MGVRRYKNGTIRLTGNDANEAVKALRGDYAIEEFNQNYSVGDVVNVRGDNGEIFQDVVKYPASVMGGHTAMAWLKGKGSYLLERVLSKVT
jgi:hypothetical protein